MKGVITKAVWAAGCSGLLATNLGCNCTYRDFVDPCYPQRYSAESRDAVHDAFAPQVQNGHILDQTMWNYHFEEGTEHLNQAGLEHLAYLARRRPVADPVIFLQTAQDLRFDPTNPDRFITARNELDSKRVQSVQTFLRTQCGGRAIDFQVSVHDPSEVGMPAAPASTAIQKLYGGYQGNLGQGPSGTGAAPGR
jgi:hypothetical protein